MKKSTNINFHQTFYPDLQHISKINIEIANNYDEITKEEISNITGIPTGKSSGKVEPHIYYSNFMNLIEYEKASGKYRIIRTELGELVSEEDPYFLEDITKQICNYFLTSKFFGADIWFYICRKLVFQYGNNLSEKLIKESTEKEFNVELLNLTPFRSCYLTNNSLQSINFIDIDNNIYIFKPLRYNPQYAYAYAYTLIKELEEYDSKRKEFTVNEVFNEILWNRGFGWNEDEAMSVIEKISEKGILNINRQLNPATVLINKNSGDLLSNIYSLLI
ncbi:hypothetical protein RBH29_11700 [Herbivorax sp. ANBcel31]|uniref:hypothetical protein n=1 Tax=Herbivorax sp. ANBcel31 TaxID=3069754 RepID=UPI0027B4A726|nr:hypothetical protein [Herbivorax sp. ANBcel31]MDQ2087089.1 hypothetical protein [Herbivorax sp. ANBcel31]